MMHRGLSLGSMLWLAACAGTDGTREDVAEADQPLALAQLTEEALVIETALLDDSFEEDGIDARGQWWLPPPVFHVLERLGAKADPQCVNTDRSLDRDGDGLPADAVSTLACTTEVAGTVIDASGRVRVVDLDDTQHHAGYRMEFDDLAVRETVPGADLERIIRLDGRATVTLDGYFLGWSTDRELVLTTSRRAQSNELERVLTMVTSAHYTPAREALARRDPFARGALDLVGQWRVRAADHEEATFVWTDPRLYYDRACAAESGRGPGFVRGTLHTGNDRGEVMNLIFTGCSDWSYNVGR